MKKTLALLSLLAMSGMASAFTVSYNVPFGPTSIGASSFNVTLPKLPASYGLPLLVTIQLDASTTDNALIFDNEAGSAGSVTLQVGTTVTATAPSIAAAIATPAISGTGSVTADDEGTADFVGGDAFGISGGSGSDSDSQSSSVPAVLASYGASFLGETFDTSIANSIFTSTSTSGIFGPTSPTAGTFSGTVTVIYEVPEPSSAALVGLVGVGALLRRRRN